MKLAIRTILPALVLASLAGCDIFDDDSFQNQKLAEAQALWRSRNVASYTYVLELQCFCAPAEQLRPVLVTVQNGATTSLQYHHDDPAQRTPAPAEVFGAYDTVEELFAVVRDAIDRDANVLQVGYNQEYGFPEIINVDYHDGGSDQKLLFVTRFTPSP